MNDSSLINTSADEEGQVLDYKTAMMELLMWPDSHYEKRSVSAMNTAHRNIRNEVGYKCEILYIMLGVKQGLSSRKKLPLNPDAAKFYGMPEYTRLPKPIYLSDSLFPALTLLPAG